MEHSQYIFPAGAKDYAISYVMAQLYSVYNNHSITVVRALIERNAVLSNDEHKDGFWYKENTYMYDATVPRYKVNIPLHPELHSEMEALFVEERDLELERSCIKHWLTRTLNFCSNPCDVKLLIPDYVYEMMPDSVKGTMALECNSILCQKYNMRDNTEIADQRCETIKLRIMMNHLLG